MEKSFNEIYNILIEYIENNEYKHGIGYKYSIGTLQDLLNEIKKEYDNLGLNIEEKGDE